MILSKVYEDAENRLKRNEITLGEFERLVDIEVEKVVYCKECRHSFINENHPQKPRICGLTKKCGTTKDDWFCADGERREP